MNDNELQLVPDETQKFRIQGTIFTIRLELDPHDADRTKTIRQMINQSAGVRAGFL